ncbi:MAG: hypothetical protein Q9163_001586 [Psora crenata]
MASSRTSLSSKPPISDQPRDATDHCSVSQPRIPRPLKAAHEHICEVDSLNIKVPDKLDGAVPAILHIPQGYQRETNVDRGKTAAILLSGAGGGVVGPSSMYLSIAEKLACLTNGIPALRLDYRYPADNQPCVSDLQAAMAYLETNYAINRFVLVGWSFGGAPVFTVGGSDRRVVGCATVASQTASTDGIRTLAPTPVLLLHGTGDKTLSPYCSQRLYDDYGSKEGERTIRLFKGDDHALTRNSLQAEELLCEFIIRCAGQHVDDDEKAIIKDGLVPAGDKVDLMHKGGDLRGSESVD